MQLDLFIQGHFRRQLRSGAATFTVNDLTELVVQVEAVAQQLDHRSLLYLHQSFGLDSLPQAWLVNQLKTVKQVTTEEQLYLLPGLRWLRPVATQPTPSQVPLRYDYWFQGELDHTTVALALRPDDPQCPFFEGEQDSIRGQYVLKLAAHHHAAISDVILLPYWQEAERVWANMSPVERLRRLLLNPERSKFSYPLPNNRGILWLDLEDFTPTERSAWLRLRAMGLVEHPAPVEALEPQDEDTEDTETIDPDVEALVEAYLQRYELPHSKQRALERLTVLPPAQSPPLCWVLGQGADCNRNTLENIIRRARRWLCVSSFIIEDEAVSQLLAQRAKELPDGVWILTNLQEDALDFIDAQVKTTNEQYHQYHRSYRGKKVCMALLCQQENLHIRSGLFHWKAIISEQTAYMGSCNLTGGSLERNLEAGFITEQTALHQELLAYFRHAWNYEAEDEAIPHSNHDGFLFQSIPRRTAASSFQSPSLLTPQQYRQDLQAELDRFQGQVSVLSRSFSCGDIDLPPRSQVWVDPQFLPSYSQRSRSAVTIRPWPYCHAKVTLLGTQVAYVGGINFNFANKALHAKDLMYKTTDIREIRALQEQIQLVLNK